MKLTDVVTFKQKISEAPPSICLVIAKEPAGVCEALFELWGPPSVHFDKENFSRERFTQEVETLPFLTKKVVVHVRDLEQIKANDLNTLLLYVKKPNPWVHLLLSSAQLPLSSKLAKAVDEKGVILRLEEKGVENALADWLTHEAAASGVALPLSAATLLVKNIGTKCEILKLELEKLICFVGKKAMITPEDIETVVTAVVHETMWRLADAILSSNGSLAWKIGQGLMEEGMALFPLMASLRTQMRNGVEILRLHHGGGEAAVTRAFPYLKGWILNKKIGALRGYGISRLQKALVILFETEIKAKNSAIEHTLLFQLLLAQLTILRSQGSAATA